MKKSKLLHVISIILIVLGALSVLSNIAMFAMSSTLAETYTAMGIAPPTAFATILSIIGSVIILVAGIIGVAYKSRQLVLAMGLILAAYYIISIIYTTVTVAFSAFGLISLIWPLLYLWGWYQSN